MDSIVDDAREPKTFAIAAISAEDQILQYAGLQPSDEEASVSLTPRDPASFYVDQYLPSIPSPPSRVGPTCEVVADVQSSSFQVDSASVNSGSTGRLLDVCNDNLGSITARVIEDVFRERRRQVKLQSLEDVVVLLAIPRFKLNGQLNHRWHKCKMVSPGFEAPRLMTKQLEDPITGDIIFSFSRRPLCNSTTDRDEGPPQMTFALQCCCCGDEDRPNVNAMYSIPIDKANMFSLRDGQITSGDRGINRLRQHIRYFSV
eukprot:Gregarina_sp_Poly_1__6566@NODE_351_length_9317_cov_65_080541_g294_i0_p4_GENE_NODE_351_length_9317_cov_65_080541_g294_i0NODE_351_length_9317_cov_65_080541_g294_i0_p4_ORF_typecomplete_len259_score18_25_NODE_351_length_9317_cov_65_080541_g294_i084839259